MAVVHTPQPSSPWGGGGREARIPNGTVDYYYYVLTGNISGRTRARTTTHPRYLLLIQGKERRGEGEQITKPVSIQFEERKKIILNENNYFLLKFLIVVSSSILYTLSGLLLSYSKPSVVGY